MKTENWRRAGVFGEVCRNTAYNMDPSIEVYLPPNCTLSVMHMLKISTRANCFVVWCILSCFQVIFLIFCLVPKPALGAALDHLQTISHSLILFWNLIGVVSPVCSDFIKHFVYCGWPEFLLYAVPRSEKLKLCAIFIEVRCSFWSSNNSELGSLQSLLSDQSCCRRDISWNIHVGH